MTVKVRRGITAPGFANRASSVQGRARGAGLDSPFFKEEGACARGWAVPVTDTRSEMVCPWLGQWEISPGFLLELSGDAKLVEHEPGASSSYYCHHL